jgi:hypothetical protein
LAEAPAQQVRLVDLPLVVPRCRDDVHSARSLRHAEKIHGLGLRVNSISDYILPQTKGQNHDDSGQKRIQQ